VPAAAGTPAPIAYVNAAAVKELVAGYRPRRGGSPEGDTSPFRAQWRGRVGWALRAPWRLASGRTAVLGALALSARRQRRFP
jgi:hypothetical protein